MKEILYNEEKNEELRETRNIDLKEIQQAILAEENTLIDVIDHPNTKRYPKQRIFVISIKNYIYLVPFVENDQQIFLKTAFPSRKYKKRYKKD